MEPMAAAPMKYDQNGKPLWDKMWGHFCGLAAEGGPSHKPTEQKITFDLQQTAINNQEKLEELIRGLTLLKAKNIETGKNLIKVDLKSRLKANWFSKIINKENVESKVENTKLILPYSDKFEIEKEIKSLITVWGKASHYWNNHRPISVKIFMYLFKKDPIAKIDLT